jgi:hypothetical protein
MERSQVNTSTLEGGPRSRPNNAIRNEPVVQLEHSDGGLGLPFETATRVYKQPRLNFLDELAGIASSNRGSAAGIDCGYDGQTWCGTGHYGRDLSAKIVHVKRRIVFAALR